MDTFVMSLLFCFACLTLILSQLKGVKDSFLIHMLYGMSFVILGFSIIAPICYIGWLNFTVEKYCPAPEANNFHFQQETGYMFAIFGYISLIITIIKWFSGTQDKSEEWYPNSMKPSGIK